MRVYLSVDMEGIAGVVHYEQTDPQGIDYPHARQWMEGEAAAAVEGACDAGAAEVTVADAHGGNGYRSLRPQGLPPAARLITGSPARPGGQLEGLDAGFDALMLIGYHVRQGAAGVLGHTTNGRAVANVWLNGMLVGECGLNMAVAGALGVPTVLITGDDRTVAEVRRLVPAIEGAIVKQAIDQYAARCLHPDAVRRRIRECAARALARRAQIPPLRLASPVMLRVQFKDTASGGRARGIPGVRAVRPDTVEATAESVPDAYRIYRAIVALAVPGFGAWIGAGR